MKRITLTEWAEVTLSRTPHINTLRSWAKNGNIPGAVKFGRTLFVPAGVEYQPVPVSDRVREILPMQHISTLTKALSSNGLRVIGEA